MKILPFVCFLGAATLAGGTFAPLPGRAATPAGMSDLFEDRIRSVVAVEFFVETEIDRRPSAELGVVIDDQGLILVPEHAIPAWVPVNKLKDFKISPLRTRSKFPGEYLGQEPLNGWHFLRVANEELHQATTPVTVYDVAEPRMGEELWGIAVMDQEHDFEPYFLSSRFSLLRELPRNVAFATGPVASPGSLIFTFGGALVGWGGASYLTEAVLHLGNDRIPVAIQGQRESGAYLPAADFLPYLDRVPADPEERTAAWLGVASLQPVEREVAEFLGLDERGGVILSELIEGSPAAQADLASGDVVIAIDGEPIPLYRPRAAVTEHLQREILKRSPGDRVELTLLRDAEEIRSEVELGLQPPTLREAKREYFAKIGLTVREFLLFDGVARRVGAEMNQGLIVQFVRPNGPAHTAGLAVGDWIQEVDGVKISAYDNAVELLAGAEEMERRETVLLVNRNNETSVVRVRLR